MKQDYYFKDGKFNIENYAEKSPFCNFLPAVAGLDGCPLWAFYINRGQGIAGFGTGGKNTPVMEFSPAEIAYANAPRQGFRTFLRIDNKPYEAFGVGGVLPTKMEIYKSGFSIEENSDCYKIRAEYFGVPNKDFAALARIVYYTNTTDTVQHLEYLDGLAQILPYGLSNDEFKMCGNLLKSWAEVKGVDEGFAYVKMRSSTADSSAVGDVCGGNFYLPVNDTEVVVDCSLIFGEDRTKTTASVFFRNGIDRATVKGQCVENAVFCAFTHGRKTVGAGETIAICSLTGYVPNISCIKKIKSGLSLEAMLKMQSEAEAETDKIASKVRTKTAFPLFDEYIAQSYFDNVLRGGMPTLIGGKPYYVFSRKHGDPEREYNAFFIEPKPYSCGNGNFRDIAQNRRNDLFITPECGDFNINYFFSLLQADGYNPLHVNGVRYTLKTVPEKWSAHAEFLKGKFSVGDAVLKLNLAKGELDELISLCEPVYEADFGEGYWSDHFVYLIDLVEAYLAVYPDKKDALLYGGELGWFKSSARLLPADRRAVISEDGEIRRLFSLEFVGENGWTKSGNKVYKTTLATKLLFLALIKLATLDPIGCGIDMEAGKPGWCDALNGLPGLFGSNVADSLELLRLINSLCEMSIWQGGIEWSAEQNELFESVLAMLDKGISADEFYFETVAKKQEYLKKAYAGFGEKRVKPQTDAVERFLRLAAERLTAGHERARRLGDGWYPTYIRFDVTDYEVADGGFVKCKKFSPVALPHFAEGVAKGLIYGGAELYERARSSELYDKKLKVYKTSESLENESIEIGRIRSFPAGWLERESCFLHMSYKLLLSLLKAGLYEEYYEEIKTGLVAFMPSSRYGRSTLENSSFIVTSNNSSPALHGKGYQARLTGANAEVISMWRLMFGIEKPFTYKNGTLEFKLAPKLKNEFFKDKKVTFRLFGKTDITYINESGKDTYSGVNAVKYKLYGEKTIETEEVVGELAENVRSGKYEKIEVTLK